MKIEKEKLLEKFKKIRKISEGRELVLLLSLALLLLVAGSVFVLSRPWVKFRLGSYGITSKASSLDQSVNALLNRWEREGIHISEISRKRLKRGKEAWNHSIVEITFPRSSILAYREKELREEVSRAGGEIYEFTQYAEKNMKAFKVAFGIRPIHTHLLYLKQPLSPRIAIIIDDLGWNREIAGEILAIDVPISLSIIPGLPYSTKIAEDAGKKKRDVLVHLPMESHNNYQNTRAADVLKTEMSRDTLERKTAELLSSVPYSVGANNHMGSKFTENREAMRIVLNILKSKNLFFVDSRTTADTVAYTLAKELKIKTAQRNVFLDNAKDKDSIKKEIQRLIALSQKNDDAIAIGHPEKNTVAAIKEMIPVFKQNGIEVVPVSQLVY
jgi:polysaccharide deacetylase 2 family uncharacterized protein YibQ